MIKVEFQNDNCLEPTDDGSGAVRVAKGAVREYESEDMIPLAFRASVKVLQKEVAAKAAKPKPAKKSGDE